MQYIIQILAVMLIGTSIATLLGPRNAVLVLASIIAVAFGVATFFMPAWWVLWAGAIVFVIGHALQRDSRTLKHSQSS